MYILLVVSIYIDMLVLLKLTDMSVTPAAA